MPAHGSYVTSHNSQERTCTSSAKLPNHCPSCHHCPLPMVSRMLFVVLLLLPRLAPTGMTSFIISLLSCLTPYASGVAMFPLEYNDATEEIISVKIMCRKLITKLCEQVTQSEHMSLAPKVIRNLSLLTGTMHIDLAGHLHCRFLVNASTTCCECAVGASN